MPAVLIEHSSDPSSQRNSSEACSGVLTAEFTPLTANREHGPESMPDAIVTPPSMQQIGQANVNAEVETHTMSQLRVVMDDDSNNIPEKSTAERQGAQNKWVKEEAQSLEEDPASFKESHPESYISPPTSVGAEPDSSKDARHSMTADQLSESSSKPFDNHSPLSSLSEPETPPEAETSPHAFKQSRPDQDPLMGAPSPASSSADAPGSEYEEDIADEAVDQVQMIAPGTTSRPLAVDAVTEANREDAEWESARQEAALDFKDYNDTSQPAQVLMQLRQDSFPLASNADSFSSLSVSEPADVVAQRDLDAASRTHSIPVGRVDLLSSSSVNLAESRSELCQPRSALDAERDKGHCAETSIEPEGTVPLKRKRKAAATGESGDKDNQRATRSQALKVDGSTLSQTQNEDMRPSLADLTPSDLPKPAPKKKAAPKSKNVTKPKAESKPKLQAKRRTETVPKATTKGKQKQEKRPTDSIKTKGKGKSKGKQKEKVTKEDTLPPLDLKDAATSKNQSSASEQTLDSLAAAAAVSPAREAMHPPFDLSAPHPPPPPPLAPGSSALSGALQARMQSTLAPSPACPPSYMASSKHRVDQSDHTEQEGLGEMRDRIDTWSQMSHMYTSSCPSSSPVTRGSHELDCRLGARSEISISSSEQTISSLESRPNLPAGWKSPRYEIIDPALLLTTLRERTVWTFWDCYAPVGSRDQDMVFFSKDGIAYPCAAWNPSIFSPVLKAIIRSPTANVRAILDRSPQENKRAFGYMPVPCLVLDEDWQATNFLLSFLHPIPSLFLPDRTIAEKVLGIGQRYEVERAVVIAQARLDELDRIDTLSAAA